FAVTENDSDYPYYWHKLSGMPRVIFCKGKRDILKDLDNGSCAVVGSREPSGYALMACSDILGDVLNKKITIVSGMALGIDRCAHKLALEKGGNTIAFLAGGPDNIYPWANKDIYDQMCYRGLIVSEMPPGTKAQRQYFPSRNRLISAISDVCIIMEAGIHSGTLHTASFAVSQGKGVYVLPNTIYSENAQGGLKLIQDGATILINSDDIINDVAECCYFRLLEKRGEIDNAIIPGSEEEMNDDQYKSLIIKELSTKPQTSDMLCTRINLPFYRITALLSELEMNGRVEQSRGKFLLTISKQ
ncbi:MAG: DNA-processing protein DprA, partial [Clostridiales bacterium]|nr:DNA-processing protein DprA [Clostridiales bacterium]